MPHPRNENECPLAELADYIDGELSPRREIELEMHLANCRRCAGELNEQKRLLSALDFALEDEKKFNLPENFTKIVVANAESKVSGLRCPQERFRAVFVIAALFLLFLLGIGGETRTVAETFLGFGEQILAVANFLFHLVFDLSVGVSIILRSVGSQFVYNSAFSTASFAAFFLFLIFALSRLINRYRQAQV